MQKRRSLKDSIIPAIIVGAILPIVVYIVLLFLTKFEAPIALSYLALLSGLAIMPTLIFLIGSSYIFLNKLILMGTMLSISASIITALYYLDSPMVETSGSTTIIRSTSLWNSEDLYSVIIVTGILAGVATIIYWAIVGRMNNNATTQANI